MTSFADKLRKTSIESIETINAEFIKLFTEQTWPKILAKIEATAKTGQTQIKLEYPQLRFYLHDSNMSRKGTLSEYMTDMTISMLKELGLKVYHNTAPSMLIVSW